MLQLLAMTCLAVAWLVPNHYPPWLSFYNECFAGAGLLLLAISIRDRLRTSAAPLSCWIVLAIAAIPLAQWLGGLLAYSGDVWITWLYLAGLGVAILVGHAWADIDKARAAVALSTATVIGALVSCALACVQALHLEFMELYVMEWTPALRPYANLGQPNNLATLIGMGAVGVLALRERGRITPFAATVGALVLAAGAALTQSRTALLFGPVVLLGVWTFKRRALPIRTGVGAVCAVTAVHWAFNFLWPTLQRALFLDDTSHLAIRNMASVRFVMWPMLLDAAAQAPWLGYGWLQVGAAEMAVVDRYPPVGELWMQGHDIFLELVLWCGVPLGVILGLLLIGWFVTRTRRVVSVEGAVGMLAIAVFGVHALLELPHHYAYFLIPVGLWSGIVESDAHARMPLSPRWNALPIASALVLLVAILWPYPEVEKDFRLARFEHLRIGTVHAAQPAPDAPALSSLTAFLRVSRMEAVRGMSDAQLADMRASVLRYPYAAGMFHLAVALALNGHADEARSVFVKIRHIHGEVLDTRLKRDLHELAEDGPPELRALEASLPDDPSARAQSPPP